MNLKKLGTALVVVLALGVVTTSSAFAENEQKNATWRVGAGGTVLSGSETVTSTGSGELVTNVGPTPLVLLWTGLECIECKIENSGGNAIGTGKLKFTGVTVKEPAVCAVSGGAVTTAGLKVNAGFMGKGPDVGQNTIRFEPASGTTFATLSLIKKGVPPCPISGNYIVSGKVFVQSNNATGVYAVSQTVTSSAAINATGGGSLTFGAAAAALNGTGTFSLSGANKGVVFGTHE